MANQNNQKTEQVAEQQAQQAETQAQQQPTEQPQIVVVQKQNGFLQWCKQHWKGLVACIAGAGAVTGSAIVAYKKGKAAGLNYAPMPEQDDYSLNPNE